MLATRILQRPISACVKILSVSQYTIFLINKLFKDTVFVFLLDKMLSEITIISIEKDLNILRIRFNVIKNMIVFDCRSKSDNLLAKTLLASLRYALILGGKINFF